MTTVVRLHFRKGILFFIVTSAMDRMAGTVNYIACNYSMRSREAEEPNVYLAGVSCRLKSSVCSLQSHSNPAEKTKDNSS